MGTNSLCSYIPIKKKRIAIADPAVGLIYLSKDEFLKKWVSSISNNNEPLGIALLLEPTSKFYEQLEDKNNLINWEQLLGYLKKCRGHLSQILISLLITTILQLIAPFLTQNIVDSGIQNQNLQFLLIILLGQMFLIISKSFLDFIRNKLILNISIILNLSILSDFWLKLTRLPISYFDSVHTGDTLLRLGDSKKIETFLTSTAFNTLFSIINFVIFSFILIIYNTLLFYVFIFGSFIYYLWVRIFLKIRRKLNYQNFELAAKEKNISLQLVLGMQELKLNNADNIKRWEWENSQINLSKLSYKIFSYNQMQHTGALLINEAKNMFLTFLVARMVIQGQLSLGSMLAIQYIIGQLNGPIEQFVNFVQSAQDAKISVERLNEVHMLKEEDSSINQYSNSILPIDKSICFKNVSFSYPGSDNYPVLKNINLTIPEGKTTAIVGVSGSGKTTLLKLLLKFYECTDGEIYLGKHQPNENFNGTKFSNLSPSYWRQNCGSVLQDGYIFNDTILNNIALSDVQPDFEKVQYACKTACIDSFIESLPNGLYTKLGLDGKGISQGQKQRIQIARAIYKNPEYIFLDEATNSLDANNEKNIVNNLQDYFIGRTVIIVAHRLSTVKNADKIVVLDNGLKIEEGSHIELINLRGKYYELVKNQLELGN